MIDDQAPLIKPDLTSYNGSTRSPAVVIEKLRRDPSLRGSETGRALLQWLVIHVQSTEKITKGLDHLPPHSVPLVAEAVRDITKKVRDIADILERKSFQG